MDELDLTAAESKATYEEILENGYLLFARTIYDQNGNRMVTIFDMSLARRCSDKTVET